MKMDDVKIIGAPPHLAQHGEVLPNGRDTRQVLGFVARRR